MAATRGAVLDRRSPLTSATLRVRFCAALLLLVPIGVYWPAVFHEYGFRDDYAQLREARDVPTNVMRFTGSFGRLLYGPLLVASVGRLDRHVAGLKWLRLTTVGLLTLAGVALWILLRRAGWSPPEAAAAGLALTLLPSAQVIVAWAIAWPLAVALLAALAGFAAIEAALARRGTARILAWIAGAGLYVLAALTYQSNAVFAVVPLAALLLARDDGAGGRARWAGAHLATLFAALILAFALIESLFALGIYPPAPVIQVEAHPFDKLEWFATGPLANAAALFALRDRFATGAGFWIAIAVVTAVIALGVCCARTPVERATWLFCLLLLPLVANAVSLLAAVRPLGYRTIFALAGLVVVLVVHSLRSLRLAGRIGAATQQAALAAMILIAGALACRDAWTLMAQPQGREWTLVRAAAQRMPLARDVSVYVIRPQIDDRSTARTYADELGSLSSDADWAVAEMFATALREIYPSGLPGGASYTFASDVDAPDAGTYDYVVDLRKLKDYRQD
jgi:hypothetical protein